MLYGRNAQGKTNCAEAVFYLCTGVSPRARRDRQLIMHGESRAEISATACGRYGDVNISASIYENGREVRVNGNKIARNADLLGNVFSVFFSPSELRLIQDGPDERRRFLNISISQLSRPYYTALLRYNKILEQRNNLLKDRDIGLVYDTLPVWDEQLAKYAAIVVRHRTDFISRLAPIGMEEHYRLTDGAEKLEVRPEKKYVGDDEELKNLVMTALGDALEGLLSMRVREGEALAEDIASKLDSMRLSVDAIENVAPDVVDEYRRKLTARITELLGSSVADMGRVATEVALFADKCADDEEISRLKAHIAAMRGYLKAEGPVGRKLDFLVQEMNREANTIGSKANDLRITEEVLKLKNDIEKIREQAQNVE